MMHLPCLDQLILFQSSKVHRQQLDCLSMKQLTNNYAARGGQGCLSWTSAGGAPVAVAAPVLQVLLKALRRKHLYFWLTVDMWDAG